MLRTPCEASSGRNTLLVIEQGRWFDSSPGHLMEDWKQSRGSFCGSAPPNHPRRCQGMGRHSGVRCKNWADTGSKFCRFHGGHLGKRHARVDKLPQMYSKHLTHTLQKVVEETLTQSIQDQLDLTEELAVIRGTVIDVCKLFDLTEEGGDARLTAGALLRATLREVVSSCEAAARVAAISRDRISVHNLSNVLNQVVRCAWQVFGDDHDKAREFEKLIKTTVRLPDEVLGTSITPEQDVLEMDDSIPKAGDDDA